VLTGAQVVDAAPNAVHALGHVDEPEVRRERAHDLEREVRREVPEDGRELGVGSGVAAVPEPGSVPRALHGRVQRGRALLAQDRAQETAEPADVVAQRAVLDSEVDGVVDGAPRARRYGQASSSAGGPRGDSGACISGGGTGAAPIGTVEGRVAMESAFLTDLVLILLVSVTVVLLLRRLRLPPLAGFLVVGVALGPHALGWVRAVDEVEALAEIGVALLLFTIGLEFSIPRILLLRRTILLGGGSQIVLTILAVWGAGLALGASSRTALLFAFLAALSSTALVLKTLADDHVVDSPRGRFAVAVLLSQDLAVIPLLLLIPLLAGGDSGGAGALGLAIFKAVLGVAIVLVFARYGFSRLATMVVRAGGRELFTLFIVLVALGAAWITHVLELPLALGAFVAGLVASVLSIVRDGREIHSPATDLCLAPSDLLVVLGNHEQLDRIRDLVAGKLQDWTPGSTRA
jgi:hypothetical protein